MFFAIKNATVKEARVQTIISNEMTLQHFLNPFWKLVNK